MASYHWLKRFQQHCENEVIDEWLDLVEEEFPGVYPRDELKMNASIYFRLLVEAWIPVETHPAIGIIPAMCDYHARRGTPASRLLHSTHLWRKASMRLLTAYHAVDTPSPEERDAGCSVLNDRLDTIQRMIADHYWTYTKAIVSQKEEVIHQLHHDRLQLLGKMAASLAHELRNPLFAIEGFLKLIDREIRGGPLESPKLLRYLDVIRKEFDGLYAQITQFLSFSKNSGVAEPFAELEVREMVAAAAEFIAPRLSSEGIELETSVEEGLRAFVQPASMQQVLINLLNNSIDALTGAEEEKRIRIEARGDASEVRIDVIDNGAGISPAMLDALFTPFVSGKAHGTGLGLAICKQIMEKNEGDITASSIPGRTTFTLRLRSAGGIVSLDNPSSSA
ncbi:HAMP domain-containing sensor histidine kinase [Paenibacillus sp.]|uniref:sensor histidine kinase n=1 Tax=Paenibacillus sp. TaxID=58172 RepID=UPI002D29F2EB|nr:HAMP domain-containing sensor histidine kinase [Paenibacillus sp.]HZG55526.1 HAMP domain-containing sensor histidine kinase [Paenibacillus sp.]